MSGSESKAEEIRQVEAELATHDPVQVQLMEEKLILVSPQDEKIGVESKKTCHLMTSINNGMLHRAFSAFIFRPSDGKLLLQKRAHEKITFPDMWTNTCCSHPLAGGDEEDMDGESIGVKRAARRKLEHELGIPLDTFSTQDFIYLTKIHYLSPSDGMWGEHEMDHIVIASKDVKLDPSPNEVSDVRYVSKAELLEMFEDENLVFTPWFKLIVKNFLFKWWDALMEAHTKDNINVQVLQPFVDNKLHCML